MSPTSRAVSLIALLGGSGVIHFVRPQTFTDLVPSWVPGTARQVVYVSGAAELATAALLAVPATRKLGGWAAVAVLVGVFPGNIKMAVDARADGVPPPVEIGSLVRLPLQIPMVLLARRVAREA
jgi:uncharacterized membrane protein